MWEGSFAQLWLVERTTSWKALCWGLFAILRLGLVAKLQTLGFAFENAGDPAILGDLCGDNASVPGLMYGQPVVSCLRKSLN